MLTDKWSQHLSVKAPQTCLGEGAGTHPTLGGGNLCLQDVGVVLGGRGRPGVDCRRDEETFRGGANTGDHRPPGDKRNKTMERIVCGTYGSSETWTCPSRHHSAVGTPAVPAGGAAPSPGRSPSGR